MEAYKGSQFNLFIPLEDSEECLIFNTFTGAEVVVDRHFKAIIENGRPPQSISPADQSNLEQLKELGIMDDEYVDEDPELEYWFQRIKLDTSTLTITILPTLACNLRCGYCLQEDLQSDTFMNQETCAAWITKKMEEVRPNTLRLIYYGGEPLLNLPAVNFFSQALHEAAAARLFFRQDKQDRLDDQDKQK